jgi:hypothetical protein
MLLHEEQKNIITGILGTVAVHLLVLIIFLVARLDKVRDVHQESIVIEFDEEEYKTLKQLMEERKNLLSDVQDLSSSDAKNIAVNTANQMEEEISTDKYLEQLKEELGIDELNQQLDRSLNDLEIESESGKKKNPDEEENKVYSGPTRIEFSLEGRTARYIHIPVYKCQGMGKVMVDIIVNQQGEVISTALASATTDETCIIETAIHSASISLFNIDTHAEAKQKGTISYEFVAQ